MVVCLPLKLWGVRPLSLLSLIFSSTSEGGRAGTLVKLFPSRFNLLSFVKFCNRPRRYSWHCQSQTGNISKLAASHRSKSYTTQIFRVHLAWGTNIYPSCYRAQVNIEVQRTCEKKRKEKKNTILHCVIYISLVNPVFGAQKTWHTGEKKVKKMIVFLFRG